MKKTLLILACMFAPLAAASSPLYTEKLSPAVIEICGMFPSYVTLSAQGIYNLRNETLYSINATLSIDGEPGLSFITPKTIPIPDIPPLTAASLDPQWTIQCDGAEEGTFLAYINYSTSAGAASSLGEATALIILRDDSPHSINITIHEGSGMQAAEDDPVMLSDNTPTISVTSSNKALCRGSFTNSGYDQMEFPFYGNGYEHNYTFSSPLKDSEYVFYVSCRPINGWSRTVDSRILFIIDTVPPLITRISPPPIIHEDYTLLNITTDEYAQCRYANENKGFDQMVVFDEQHDESFSVMLDHLEEGEHTLYVTCRDQMQNLALTAIRYTVQKPPTAQISLSQPSPLSAGTYEVTLITSKPLRSTPILTYSFTDATTFSRAVSLIKKDDTFYKGYLILEEYKQDRVGVFSFQGYDIHGNKGSKISDGAVFLVDTQKPPAPSSIEATPEQDGSITLRWYYEGEDAALFNIYRSTASGVDYIHYYDTAENMLFHDTNVEEETVYHYKIAAVDKAGNIGEVSKEAFATAKEFAENKEEEIPQPSQEPVSMPPPPPPTHETLLRYNTTLKDIETILIDLDWAESNLKEQQAKETAVEELGLVNKVMDAKDKVDKLKNQLLGIRRLSASDAELSQLLAKADELILLVKRSAPESLTVAKQTNYLQGTSNMDAEEAAGILLEKTNYSDKQIAGYIEEMQDLQSSVRVEVGIKTLHLTYIGGLEENRVLVQKKIWHESPESLVRVKAFEIIPKTVAGDMATVDVRTPDYHVVKDDPIISWDYDELSYNKKDIKYLILSFDNAETARTTRTIILKDPAEVIKEKHSMLVGFTTMLKRASPDNPFQVLLLVLGMFLAAGLLVYYITVIHEVEIGSLFSRRKKEPASLNLLSQASDYFYLCSGEVMRSFDEFIKIAPRLDQRTFSYHVNSNKNDFAVWLREVFNYHDLADKLTKIKTREELVKIIRKLK